MKGFSMALYENIFDSSDIWWVDHTRNTKFIDGVEYIFGTKPNSPDKRQKLLRKEAFRPAKNKDLSTLYK